MKVLSDNLMCYLHIRFYLRPRRWKYTWPIFSWSNHEKAYKCFQYCCPLIYIFQNKGRGYINKYKLNLCGQKIVLFAIMARPENAACLHFIKSAQIPRCQKYLQHMSEAARLFYWRCPDGRISSTDQAIVTKELEVHLSTLQNLCSGFIGELAYIILLRFEG